MSAQRDKSLFFIYAYIGLVSVALLYFAAEAADNAMGGFYAMLLTIPWSIALTLLLTAVHPTLFESLWIGPLIILISAATNVTILLYIRKRRRRNAMCK